MKLARMLQRASVEESPYPHFVINDAFDGDTLAVLHASLPSMEVITNGADPGSNKRFTLNWRAALEAERVGPVWKSIIREGIEPAFALRIAEIFRPWITREYPDFATRFAPLERFSVVPRVSGQPPESTQLSVDAQIAVNTPALYDGTSVRIPHLDWMAKLFVGLLYLRPSGDRSEGADLELYAARDRHPPFDGDRSLPMSRVRFAKRVPYRDNTLVVFLNTPRSLHGVTPRAATSFPRYFLNFIGEVRDPLFPVRSVQKEPWETVPARPSLLGRLGGWLARPVGSRGTV